MATPAAATTRGNLAYFLLGVFVALCIAGIFTLGSRLFFHWQQGATPLVTGEQDLDQLIQTDVDLFWTLVPNLKDRQVTEFLADNTNTPSTYVYSTNELGFRSPPLQPAGSRVRILALGDSTTFGQHLADDQTWPAQLQMMVDPEARQVEVINAGVIGASSFQGLSFLHARGLALKPDLVIATFGFNDWGQSELSDRERARAYQRQGLSGLLDVILASGSPDHGKEGLAPRATPGEYLDHMLAMARLCEEEKVRLVLLIWPNPFEVKDPVNNTSSYRPLLQEVCRTTAAECIDLLPPFSAATEPAFLDIIHATPAGCRIVAETLASYIKERQWIPAIRQE